ncbi:uncharacterized protein LOC124263932 [Haliotis rubra]|uniref:uncharacterized protein LOC124263932 n=1 Tax=Haliotis rubra TaxID=36100 RepID=UPI001EE5C100|nr:uncharacterized protein LOC124263932 [Haliotis rubra]
MRIKPIPSWNIQILISCGLESAGLRPDSPKFTVRQGLHRLTVPSQHGTSAASIETQAYSPQSTWNIRCINTDSPDSTIPALNMSIPSSYNLSLQAHRSRSELEPLTACTPEQIGARTSHCMHTGADQS